MFSISSCVSFIGINFPKNFLFSLFLSTFQELLKTLHTFSFPLWNLFCFKFSLSISTILQLALFCRFQRIYRALFFSSSLVSKTLEETKDIEGENKIHISFITNSEWIKNTFNKTAQNCLISRDLTLPIEILPSAWTETRFENHLMDFSMSSSRADS